MGALSLFAGLVSLAIVVPTAPVAASVWASTAPVERVSRPVETSSLTAQTPQTGQAAAADRPAIGPDPEGRLVYRADSRGNSIIDFSHAGYAGGGVPLPLPAPNLVVSPPTGDATATLQAAIDRVSGMPVRDGGLRGVILLAPGRYEVAGQLRIRVGGVILRGSGSGRDGSLIVATGVSRRSLIVVAGHASEAPIQGAREERSVVDAFVAAGSRQLTLESVDGLSVGSRILVRRPSSTAWIERLGMNTFEGWRPQNRLHWQAGSRDIVWSRSIVAIDGTKVVLDAPLTTSLDQDFGQAMVSVDMSAGILEQVGIENLSLLSSHDPARARDEDHAWFAISMDHVRDGWIRDISARGFVSYVVNLGPGSARITVQDVEASDPVSEIGGFRRRVFYSAGQQVLFNRCQSREGSSDFVLGHAAAGPNVFLDCIAIDAHGPSGPIESWASGALYDNVIVRGGGLRLTNLGREGQGVGWAAANSVLWNCQATDVEVSMPPDAYNLAIGCKGVVTGDGIVERPGIEPFRDFHRATPAQPRSLYRAQLEERLGSQALEVLGGVAYPPQTGAALQTPDEVQSWRLANESGTASVRPLSIEDGRFVIDGQEAWKRRVGYSWFQGQMPPVLARTFGPAITRFAPGRDGVGATDDPVETVSNLRPGDVFYQHYGLWYDRRRVDHNYFGAPDERTGEVWGPLMEQPWGRSGTGRAWDGLSKYDLTRFNPWYFERVNEFAREADRQGRILYYNFYFQHGLLESRSHYVDFPWRPVNALQATGLPDEVPAAEAFYDVSDPVRRDLHRRYIFHSLDVLKGRTNVVYGIDREYSGPLAFVEFWLDTIQEWEVRNGQDVKVVLEVPKAQLDALLGDARRRHLFDGMAIHHWIYRHDGNLFAIVGGINRAPREQQDAFVPPPGGNEAVGAQRAPLWETTPAMRYRAWREYADKAPELVFLFAQDLFPDLTRAIEAALPAEMRKGSIMTEEARQVGGEPSSTAWVMVTPSGNRLVYSTDGDVVRLLEPGPWKVQWIGPHAPQGSQTQSIGDYLEPPREMLGRAWAAWLVPDTVRP